MSVFPTSAVSMVSRSLRAATAYTASPFTFQGQNFDWGGRQWVYDIEVFAIGASAKALSAFLSGLGGSLTVFTLADPTINNVGTGTVTVSGGGQTGASLVTTGWVAAPEVGDFVSLGSGVDARLYQITGVSGSLPTLTLSIAPGLRSSPVNGAAVEVAAPVVALRLESAAPVMIGASGQYQANFRAIEAL